MIVTNDPLHARRICEAAGTNFNPATDASIVRVGDDGLLMGGSVFQNYTGPWGSIGIHVASFAPNWITPDLLLATFHYPFVQLGCLKLFGQVPATNEAALKFDLKLGFKVEAVVRDVYPDSDMVLVAMYREDCRWLRIRPRNITIKEAA